MTDLENRFFEAFRLAVAQPYTNRKRIENF